MQDVYENLRTLGIKLPSVSTPAAAYASFIKSDSLVFLSGHLARANGQVLRGRLGENLDVNQGQAAARQVAIDLLATLQVAVGDLNMVKRLIKVTSFVSCTPDFTSQHLVTNGCSDLFGAVFDSMGVHARSAVGVAQLPLGACIEIELIAEVKSADE